MRKLTLLLSPLLAAGLLAAVPAGARPHPHTPARAEAIRHQIDELQRDVARNDRRDHISEREATALRRDVRDLQDQFRAYNRNGLSNAEMNTLEARIHRLRDRLHREHDRDHHVG